MKVLFSIAIGSALIVGANAQLRTPPPITTAPPAAVPDLTPAAPQPGVAVGATGGLGSGTTGSTVGRGRTNTGFTTPFPVIVPSGTFPPEPIDPLELVWESELIRMLEEAPPPPPNPGTAQGRPGGLGVTITGGATSPPPATNIPVATNAPPATNTAPPADAGVTITNPVINRTYP